MSHLIKIYAVCKFSYFLHWYLKMLENAETMTYGCLGVDANYLLILKLTGRKLADKDLIFSLIIYFHVVSFLLK